MNWESRTAPVIPAQAGTHAVDKTRLGSKRSAAGWQWIWAGRRYLEARTDSDGRLDSCLRRNDGWGTALLGARQRPAVSMLARGFGDYDTDHQIPLAASLELLHTATLVMTT